MKSDGLKDRDIDIKKLTNIFSTIQDLYYKKKAQLEELELEISEIQSILTNLNFMISGSSFFSADEIHQKNLEKILSEEYFKEKIPQETVKDSEIKNKIFSNDDEAELLCILNFIDLNRVEIKFLDPEKTALKETSEDFIRILLKETLVNIKENNPDLDLEYNYHKNTGIIDSILISNIKSMKEFDLIDLKMRELLLGEPK